MLSRTAAYRTTPSGGASTDVSPQAAYEMGNTSPSGRFTPNGLYPPLCQGNPLASRASVVFPLRRCTCSASVGSRALYLGHDRYDAQCLQGQPSLIVVKELPDFRKPAATGSVISRREAIALMCMDSDTEVLHGGKRVPGESHPEILRGLLLKTASCSPA
jgi:hypothetical protein